MKMHQALIAIALPLFAFSNVTHAGAEKACPTGEGEMKKWQRSVVIAGDDKDILELEDFSFKHTIQAILKSGGLNDDHDAQVKAVQSLIDTFKQTRATHPIGGRMVEFKERDSEHSLKAKDLLNKESPRGMKAIGLFNRFDQAPLGWGYCGEHRIVYARKTSAVSPGRFFLIFEAAVANPHPEFGQGGCKPIAEMWQSLKSETDKHEIAKRLHKFYYSGLRSSDDLFEVPQALHINHFGHLLGQVRGNFFMQPPWQLREWHIDPLTGAFRMHVLGTNPQPGLYSGEEPQDPMWSHTVKGFQENFVQQVVPQLLEADSKLRGVNNRDDQKALLINNIGILGQTVAPWEDFVSNSQKGFDTTRLDDPKDAARDAEAFKHKITKAIAKVNVPNVDVDQILVRAGAMSCGGCHRFSSRSSKIGKDNAGRPIMWPQSVPRDFVHINEESKLSVLLTKYFLADRCEKMNEIFFKSKGDAASIISESNVLNIMLRQALPTALLNLRKQISSTPLEASRKEPIEQMIRQIAEEQSDMVRAIDRSTRERSDRSGMLTNWPASLAG